MSETLISHALDRPLKLKDHINQVINASRYLVSQKFLNFSGLGKAEIQEISILIAACHDFGKSTIFFQDYIKSKLDGHQYKYSEKDKSHSLISGIFGWYLTEKWSQQSEKVEERWKQFLPFAVLLAIEGHHGTYCSIEEIMKKIDDCIESELLSRQLENIQAEILYHFSFLKNSRNNAGIMHGRGNS